MPFKILLVDDEQWVIEDLKSHLNFKDYDFEIIGEASDGEEALAFIKSKHPDLVISDIKMPNMSGLVMLEKLNQMHKDTLVVFVSAYSEFELVKKAVSIGGFDYLLKPVDKNELASILVKAKEQILKKKVNTSNAIKLKLIESVDKIIEGGENTSIVSELISCGLDMTDKAFYVAVLKKRRAVAFHLNDFFETDFLTSFSIGEKRECIIFSKNNNEKIKISEMKKLIKWVNENQAMLGISRKMSSLNNLSTSFLEANIMLDQQFMTGKEMGVYFYRKPNGNVKLALPPKKDLPDFIQSLYTKLKNKKINSEGALLIYNQIIAVTMPADDMSIKDSKSLVDTYSDSKEMLNFLMGTTVAENMVPARMNEQLTEVVSYIDANYNKKLLINNLAKQFYFNSSYLSVIFKAYTGKSFTNYLMDIRFKKAKELIENTDLSLSKISEMVGYENYFHFSKLFKKYEGYAPSDYRKSNTN